MGANGPSQPLIGVVEETVPLLLRMTSVPQNAKAVLFEPVLLFIVKCNVRYTESPVVHVLQVVVPGRLALTSTRSLEVQDVAGGNVVPVCAKAREQSIQASRKRKCRLLMIRS